VFLEPSIDCRDLFVRLGDDEILVIDCRDEDEWSCYELQIPGALKMTVSELFEFADALPDDELIVLCDFSQDGVDSRRAARLLRLRGRDAVCLRGGLRAWISQGYPTERYVPRTSGRVLAGSRDGAAAAQAGRR
jgi:rhodanese-related sulfurtransferase